MSVALTINSAHTKLWLQGLHENILGKMEMHVVLHDDNTIFIFF